MISMMYVFRDKIIDGININLWPTTRHFRCAIDFNVI